MIARLLADLESSGYRVALNGERLTVRAREGTVPPEVLAEVREHKPAILALLEVALATNRESDAVTALGNGQAGLAAPERTSGTLVEDHDQLRAARDLLAEIYSGGHFITLCASGNVRMFDDDPIGPEYLRRLRELGPEVREPLKRDWAETWEGFCRLHPDPANRAWWVDDQRASGLWMPPEAEAWHVANGR